MSIRKEQIYTLSLLQNDRTGRIQSYHSGILDAIQKAGATMSHHHGIGKMFAPWLEGQIGKNQLAIFKALKKHFDPNNIMNPGGTLALDLTDDEKRFARKPW